MPTVLNGALETTRSLRKLQKLQLRIFVILVIFGDFIPDSLQLCEFSQFSLSFIEEFNPGYVMCEGLAGRCVELTVHLGWFVCRVPTAPEMPCQPIHQVSEDLQNDQEKSFDGPA